MPICPYCGATVPEGAIACGKCGASLVSSPSQPQMSTTLQSQSNSSTSPSNSDSSAWSAASYDSQLSARLQKALRRNELLSYAVIGLSIILLILLILSIV